MSRFEYLIEKISEAKFSQAPFKHVYIENFFNDEDFEEITSNSEIDLKPSASDQDLFQKLFNSNYKVIEFPGCIIDYKKYINLHSKGKPLSPANAACEGAGIVLRLNPSNEMLNELDDFLASKRFNAAIADKFGLNIEDCNVDGGIQKYLDGYEISPHPDIRRKAATFMVNINPHKDSEGFDHHTRYLKLRPEYSYVQEFWRSNENADRQWVPWDWCETDFIQSKNNSIVLFSPADDTMHAVKANYDHLQTQRTQLYGNLWYKNEHTTFSPTWQQMEAGDFSDKPAARDALSKRALRKVVQLRNKLRPKDDNIGHRGY
ncbi:MAG: hypothetical protein AAFO74_12505 [Pseudomonadota bacterium]